MENITAINPVSADAHAAYDVRALRKRSSPAAESALPEPRLHRSLAGEAVAPSPASCGTGLPFRTRRDFRPSWPTAPSRGPLINPTSRSPLPTNTTSDQLAARIRPSSLETRPGERLEFPANVFWRSCRQGCPHGLVPLTPEAGPTRRGLQSACITAGSALATPTCNFTRYAADLDALGAGARDTGTGWWWTRSSPGSLPSTCEDAVDILACGAQKWLPHPWGRASCT